MIILRPKRLFRFPIEASCITPDSFSEKKIDEISSLKIWEGNRKRTLGEILKIEEEADTKEDVTIRILGNVDKLRRIGTGMSKGEIIIEGDAGMHVGEEMKGGSIKVTGNADSWVGCMMTDGRIEIDGNAGDYVGSTYRGANMKGMRGGEIIIHGSAGNELGYFMRNGLIKVGNVGQFAGIHMKNGTIFVKGNSEGRCGAEMLGGKIVVCGRVPAVIPTFTIDSIRKSVRVNGERIAGPFYRFFGDIADNGNGRLFISQIQNPHLSVYEKYLS